MYGSFVVDIKEHKEEKERTRFIVGGDQIEYPGDKSTRTAGLTTAKILINSVVSTLERKCTHGRSWSMVIFSTILIISLN
jgi:hypothetical protein